MTVSKIDNGVCLSITTLAIETGKSRDAIRTLLENANVRPVVQDKRSAKYRLRDVLTAIYRVGDDGEIDPDKLDPFNRKLHWQAEHEKDRVATDRRMLIPRKEHETEIARVVKAMLSELEPLPDRLERDTGLTPQQAAMVELAVDKVREAIYLRVIDDEESDQEGKTA